MRRVILVLMTTTLLNAGFTQSDSTRIFNHFKVLLAENRSYNDLDFLNASADYIHEVFSKYSTTAVYQEFDVNARTYKNVLCSFGPSDAPRIVIGAHYDVCGLQPGADDNASGVIGLLELAYLLQNVDLKYRVDLVAYTLEEPPYFRTEQMGSYVHAKSLNDDEAEVLGMVVLEMIGYFDDSKGSQDYPAGFLRLFYGNKGNFITLVKKFRSGRFARRFNRKFKNKATIRSKTFTGPPALPGIDFSDHLNYWKFGYSALMITDTSFYRNKNYHEPWDTLDTIDIVRMAEVINSVFNTIQRL